MIVWRRLADMVATHGAAALVSVHEVRGSAPREAGARMVVRPDGAFHGTIGGGQLEWQMLGLARAALAAGRGRARFVDQALGPDLGQCCGGRVTVLIETFGPEDAEELAELARAEAEGREIEAGVEDGRVRRRPVPARGGAVPPSDRMSDGASSSAGSDRPPSPTLARKGGEGRSASVVGVVSARPTELSGATPLTPPPLRGRVGRGVALRSSALEARSADPRSDQFAPGPGAPPGSSAAALRPRDPEPLPARGRGDAWREPASEPLTPLALFGAGHIGRALVLALAPLPFAVRWIDSREDAFPAHIPAHVTPVRAADPEAEVARLAADSLVLVMTHEHPLDLAITAAALTRGFPFVGLIGSATKRARFEKRFRELGIPKERIGALACPIGVPGITGKEPPVIAASAVAQLLQVREKGAIGFRETST